MSVIEERSAPSTGVEPTPVAPLRQALDPSPLVVAAIALLIAVAFVAVRAHVVADGRLDRFPLVAEEYAHPGQLPAGMRILPGTGYDGQFFWRIAVDPSDLRVEASNGLHLDSPLRSQRIGYPLVAWLLAAGNTDFVPATLVLVNVLALAGLAGLGAVIARDARLPSTAGLVLVLAVPAFWFSISRDLSEPLAVLLLLGGLYAVRRERFAIAALCWSGAVLTREQTVLVVAVYGVSRLASVVRDRRVDRRELAWAGPAALFLLWQVVLLAATGSVPLLSSTETNLVVPFTDLAPAVGGWIADLPAPALSLLTISETPRAVAGLLLLATLVVLAVRRSSTRIQMWERGGVVALALLVVSLSSSVWIGPADFRTAADLSSLSWVLVLSGGDRRTVTMLAVPATLLTLAVMVSYARVI